MKANKSVVIGVFMAFFLAMQGHAQSLGGEVLDAKKTPLPEATLVWAGTSIGARTGQEGLFSIPLPKDTSAPQRLVVFYGEIQDTFEITNFYSFWTVQLQAEVMLKEVLIQDQTTGAYVSVLQPIKTEIINRAELRKAACCDLAGCFETQATVQPTTTNVLTNAKELRILGLSGVYNQILLDGLPTIQGLTYTYGTGTIPGSMLEQIWVVKGANSVLQGFEPMVGQITIFPREGGTAEPYTADVLVNSFGEKHLNAAMATKKKEWTNYLALHASLPGGKWDRDDDGFRDLPKLTRYSLYNKLRYRKENELGWSAFVAVRLIDEERIGGQTTFDAKTDLGTTRAYGQLVQFRQPEVLSKSGYRFDENNKISLLTSFVGQNQDSWFGLTHYEAQQRSAYANLQYELFWGKNKTHELKAGASMRHFVLDENIGFAPADTLERSYAGSYLREENTPGLFAEQVLHIDNDRWVLVTGLRADHHQAFGWRVVPRGLLRFSPNPNLDLRVNAGTGWRTVQLFPENIGLLTGNRDIVFREELQPEASTNYGFSVTKRWAKKSMKYTLSGDLYYTRFSNQFFPDYDTDASKAIIANYTGHSVSNAAQLEASMVWLRQIEIRAAYTYLDVFRGRGAEKLALPFNPKHKILGVVTYRTPSERWQFDANLHYYGKQRLPNTKNNPLPLQRPDFADAFTVCSVQASYTHGRFSFFGGCENLFDFRQKQPILGWEQPFARGFDPAFAWGPTRGREFYVGSRMKL